MKFKLMAKSARTKWLLSDQVGSLYIMETLNWEITCVPDRMAFHNTTEEGVQIGTCKLFISELCVFARARTPVFMCAQIYLHGGKRKQPLVSFRRTSTLFLYLVLFSIMGMSV